MIPGIPTSTYHFNITPTSRYQGATGIDLSFRHEATQFCFGQLTFLGFLLHGFQETTHLAAEVFWGFEESPWVEGGAGFRFETKGLDVNHEGFHQKKNVDFCWKFLGQKSGG